MPITRLGLLAIRKLNGQTAQGIWSAPGGGTAYVDPATGESILVFHALKTTENGAPYLWVKHIQWQNDWPLLVP
jgi:hypothetical protein